MTDVQQLEQHYILRLLNLTRRTGAPPPPPLPAALRHYRLAADNSHSGSPPRSTARCGTRGRLPGARDLS